MRTEVTLPEERCTVVVDRFPGGEVASAEIRDASGAPVATFGVDAEGEQVQYFTWQPQVDAGFVGRVARRVLNG